MRSPWLIQTGCCPPISQMPSNSAARALDLDIGAAELAVMAALDRAAELGRHGHLAVADAEHGHAGLEDRLRRARRAFLVHRVRPAGQDHRLRLHLKKCRFRLLERHDFGIDALLAHAPRDQLRDLAAEIDDQNLVMRRGHGGHRLGGGARDGCGCHGKQIRDRSGRRNPERPHVERAGRRLPVHVRIATARSAPSFRSRHRRKLVGSPRQ